MFTVLHFLSLKDKCWVLQKPSQKYTKALVFEWHQNVGNVIKNHKVFESLLNSRRLVRVVQSHFPGHMVLKSKAQNKSSLQLKSRSNEPALGSFVYLHENKWCARKCTIYYSALHFTELTNDHGSHRPWRSNLA